MNVETVARTIQLILAPVVMVTACSILLGSLQTRYGVINDRLRAMARERLDLLQSPAGTAPTFVEERLSELDTQIPLLLKHHQLAHHAVLMVYCAIVVFIADMFVIAIGAVANIDLVATAVLLLFLLSTGLLFIGALYAVREVSTSQQALYYELRRVANLPRGVQTQPSTTL
ncbi:MAG: DUF2721 domain-containing protein [Chloroflexota bacterium]